MSPLSRNIATKKKLDLTLPLSPKGEDTDPDKHLREYEEGIRAEIRGAEEELQGRREENRGLESQIRELESECSALESTFTQAAKRCEVEWYGPAWIGKIRGSSKIQQLLHATC